MQTETKSKKPSKKIILIGLSVLAGLCIICAVAGLIISNSPEFKAGQTATAQVLAAAPKIEVTKVEAAQKEAKQTNTKAPTNTLAPTKTFAPTNTPAHTDTPSPTETNTPAPEPVEFSGNNDQIVDFENVFRVAFIHVTHTGPSNFVIYSLDGNNEEQDLLVNTIGDYEGYRPLDWDDGHHTMRFKVKAEGDWKITVYPIAAPYVRECKIPGVCKGSKDDVFALVGGTPDKVSYKFSGESNVVVYGYSGKRVHLIVNEIAPVDGSNVIPGDVIFLDVHADGEWEMDIQTR